MKIITRILSKKVSTILLGMKIRYTLKKKLIRIKKYTIKYRIIHINNIDNGQNNLTTFECLENNFFMTASSILNNLNLVGEMYLTLGKKLFRLREDDFLFDKCLFLEDKNIKNNNVNGLSTLCLVPNATIFVINSIKHNWFTSVQNLRVLIIKKSFVQNVCLDDLKFLNYLDLSHNYLENIKITKTLQHCNLSHNNLSWCNVRAHFMDLSYNSITFIDFEFKFHNLNLSFNPLEVLSANGNLINISNTKIKNVLCRGIKRLICRNNKKVVLYCTENVSYLDLDNCGLEFLKLNQNNSLEVVKLRNNKLTSLPNLGRLKYLDVSGNKLCCFGKYPAVYINVSRNPIRYILSSNNYTHVDLSYINIDRSNIKIDKNNGKSNGYNDHLIANLNQMKLSSKQVIKKKHNFKRIKKIVVTIPRLTFCKFIFVTALDSELDLENFLKMALSIVDTKIDNHNFFMKLIDLYEKFIRESLCSTYFYSIMIEENLISVKSTNLPLVFASFVVHEIIENDKIFVFENIGDWNCFPLLGCTDFIRRRSSYLKPYSIYCYMDIYCSYTKDLEVKNNIELYKGGNRDIKVVKDIVLNAKCLKNDFELDINSYIDLLKTKSIIPTYGFNTCSVSHLEYLTLDTEKLLPTPGFVHSKEDKISHDRSTFIFLKINSATSRNPITSSPYNYIIGVLCRSFQTILFEQHDNQCNVFLGFNCKQGLIFAMYIYRIMIYKGINLSIGVACGALSIRWSHLFPKVFGFGLNKSARFASMGEGVFCCKCMKIDHKDLAYKFHGKKFMKGFDERFEVYSVHFKHPYKIFM